MPTFSLASMGRALQRALGKIPILRPGGYFTLPTPGYLQASLTGLGQALNPFAPGATITPKGEVISGALAESGQAPTAPAVQYRPAAEASGLPTDLGKIFKTTTATKGAPTPTPTPKAEITRIKPAPTDLSKQPPPPTPPPVAGGGAPLPPATAPGFTAPTLSSLPPAPVQTPIQTPRPAIPVGQFEAMIRALAELSGSRYVPMPLSGVPPFGPVGALSRALERFRKRELGLPET